MADLPTLEAAMKLADQDSPLPGLAGPALKRLRNAVNGLSIYDESMQDAMVRIIRAAGLVGGTPPEVAAEVEKRLTNRAATQADKGDSATLTALIAELRAREVVGRAKYGTDVDRADLTNPQWRQHLREELMDALLYSLAEERTAPPSMAELAALGRIRPIRLAEEPTHPAAAMGCWCEVCDPALVGIVMVLCPTCGNKRCPHAHDHRNACTHSNAVGQPGSSWEHVKPTAPPAPEDC